MSATETQPLELIVSVKGEIIKSNFDEFEAYALEQLAAINTDLNTDEDFGQAAADEKALKEAETKFKEVETQILEEMDSISDLIKRTRGLGEKYAQKRLALTKELKSRRDEIIDGIKEDAIRSISVKHPDARRRISEAMKGKRTLESLKKHATAEAVTIEAEVQRARSVVDEFLEEQGRDIVHDEHKLLVMDAQAVEAELSRRVERKAAMLREAELKAEAEKARQEAVAEEQRRAEWERREAEVKAEQIEEKPAVETPPPVVPPQSQPTAPSEPRGESQEEELLCYLNTLRASFAPLKPAREGLRHPMNIELAQAFSGKLNAAFAELKGGLK